jgi:hypothetical protein
MRPKCYWHAIAQRPPMFAVAAKPKMRGQRKMVMMSKS